MKVLFLAPYPLGKAPSQRFRFEHFLKAIEEAGMQWDFESFISDAGWEILYKEDKKYRKALEVIAGFIRRKLMLLRASRYDLIFIHRELTPFGPPFFEWFLARVLKKRIIYDFDDAIWISDREEKPLRTLVKWRSKVARICQWSYKVSVGNEFLAEYAREFNPRVTVLPTVVDTTKHQPPSSKPQSSTHQRLTLGWTGSHSTLFYLEKLVPVLQELEEEYEIAFLVIANKDPKLPLKHYRFLPWSKESEVSDLAQIDIGVMPLMDDPWARGKCGFKLIQYMALAIPTVASPVGVNDRLITHGINGYLADRRSDWKKYLIELIEKKGLRKFFGENGRKFIDEHFSTHSQKEEFLKLFS